MFEKKSTNDESYKTDDSLNVSKPSKRSAKVIIGNGVKMMGEITEADDVQIDGNADVTMNTLNLLILSETFIFPLILPPSLICIF